MKNTVMTTLSFQIEPAKVPEVCSMLMQYGITDIRSKENLPNHILKEVEISLQESERKEVITSEKVHKEIEEYVQSCLDK